MSETERQPSSRPRRTIVLPRLWILLPVLHTLVIIVIAVYVKATDHGGEGLLWLNVLGSDCPYLWPVADVALVSGAFTIAQVLAGFGITPRGDTLLAALTIGIIGGAQWLLLGATADWMWRRLALSPAHECVDGQTIDPPDGRGLSGRRKQ